MKRRLHQPTPRRQPVVRNPKRPLDAYSYRHTKELALSALLRKREK